MHEDIAAVLNGEKEWCVVTADALEVLPTLPEGCVNAVLTDPPYGVRSEEWDAMDEHEFARFSMAWLAQAKRVGKEMVSFCSAYGPFRPLCEMLWPRVRQMIWHKPLGSQYAGAKECKLWFSYDPILHCHNEVTWRVCKPKMLEVATLIRAARERARLSRGGVDMAIRGRKTGLCYRWEEADCLPTLVQAQQLCSLLGLGGEFTQALERAYADKEDTLEKAAEKAAEKADVLSYQTVTKGVHPCEKPVPLLVDLLETVGEQYQIILDPFVGSGSTGVACLKTGRRFIGLEIDPRYCDIARRRLTAAEADQRNSLFPARDPGPQQRTFADLDIQEES